MTGQFSLSSGKTFRALLAKGGITVDKLEVVQGEQGGNNRIDIIQADRDQYVAKWYFSSDRDQRDRLGSEWSFLSYAQSAGLRSVPRPLASLPEQRVALYEYLPGRKLSQKEIGLKEVCEAAQFLSDLNHPSLLRYSAGLQMASEAFWSAAGHIEHIDSRLARFNDVILSGEIDESFASLRNELQNLWQQIKTALRNFEANFAFSLDEPLVINKRMISPSDFGFHNILFTPQDGLKFIDFEYAGWDDPAKSLSDFFLQPALPVPFEYFESFVGIALQNFSEKEKILERVKIMLPLFALKWCCIILNPFVPEWADRSKFANNSLNLANLKAERLVKAEDMLSRSRYLLGLYQDI